MYDPYEDAEFMYWLENTERGMLELAYIDLKLYYLNLKSKYEKHVNDTSWERTARQQERSGGWM